MRYCDHKLCLNPAQAVLIADIYDTHPPVRLNTCKFHREECFKLFRDLAGALNVFMGTNYTVYFEELKNENRTRQRHTRQ